MPRSFGHYERLHIEDELWKLNNLFILVKVANDLITPLVTDLSIPSEASQAVTLLDLYEQEFEKSYAYLQKLLTD